MIVGIETAVTSMDTRAAEYFFREIVPSFSFREEKVIDFVVEPFSRGALQEFLRLCGENGLKASGTFQKGCARIVVDRRS